MAYFDFVLGNRPQFRCFRNSADDIQSIQSIIDLVFQVPRCCRAGSAECAIRFLRKPNKKLKGCSFKTEPQLYIYYLGSVAPVSIKFNCQLNLIAQISPINFNWRFRDFTCKFN